MPSFPYKMLLASGAICLSTSLLCTGCIDDSYDLSKDIDLTVGLGGDGLAVRLGNTEPIKLDNILDVDQSVKLDGMNRYYLVEDGTTEVSFDVPNVSTHVSRSLINTSYHVIDYAAARTQFEQEYGVSVPDGTTFAVPSGFKVSGMAEGQSHVKFNVSNVHEAIVQLQSVKVQPLHLMLRVENRSAANMKFDITSMDNLRIELPQMLELAGTSNGRLEGNTLVVDHVDCTRSSLVADVTVSGIRMGADGTPTADRHINFSDANSSISLEGTINFTTTAQFNIGPTDYADVNFSVTANEHDPSADANVVVTTATGRFNPEIAPDVDPINVAESLPDFLQDEAVSLPVTNPTVRFEADMTDIPADLNFSALLTAEKAGKADVKLNLPAQGKATLQTGRPNTLYFYQGTAPYDPQQAVPATAQTHQVNNIASLINPLPDDIRINIGGGRVQVPNDKSYTIELGRNYTSEARYAVFVPFEFSHGLTIVYNDSTNSMNDDLKDYSAEGVRINAKVENTIPLALVGSIRAVDVNGNELPGIRFSEVSIQAGNGDETPVVTDVVVEAKLDNPDDLKRVDRFFFNVHAASGETTATHTLVSTQYLRLTDVRLRLTGRVTANLN